MQTMHNQLVVSFYSWLPQMPPLTCQLNDPGVYGLKAVGCEVKVCQGGMDRHRGQGLKVGVGQIQDLWI